MADAPAIPDLKWAHHQYQSSKRRRDYDLFRRYYEGDHRLAFATQHFRSTFGQIFQEFAENLIPAVVDSMADRLEITGFQTSASQMVTEDVAAPPLLAKEGVPPRQKVSADDPLGKQAWDIWERNQMDVGANEIHVESLLMGDSYALVWPNDQMQAEIWPQYAQEMSVQYDPNVKERIVRASKCWYDDLLGYWRLNIYTEMGIDKYRSKRMNAEHSAAMFPASEQGWDQYESVNNPYTRVPVFHFPNKTIRKWGKSRVRDVIPIQDGLNKSVMDLLVTMEFAAYKQRYIIGAEPEESGEEGEPTGGTADDRAGKGYGVDRLMSIPDPEAKVGQFDATDLSQFLKVQEKFWASAARVSGTPLHYFFITSGDFPSGEAMKSAEARFIKALKDQQGEKGAIWGEVLKFCLEIENRSSVPKELEIKVEWTDASPRSESELADTAVKKEAVGVPESQILREFGYSEDEIDRMLQETQANRMTKMLMDARNNPANQNGNQGPGNQSRSTAQGSGQNTRGVKQ